MQCILYLSVSRVYLGATTDSAPLIDFLCVHSKRHIYYSLINSCSEKKKSWLLLRVIYVLPYYDDHYIYFLTVF